MSLYEELRNQGEAEETAYVDVQRRGDSAVLTLSEPGRLNVLSAPLVVQTKAAIAELVADPAVRSVVLTGAGAASAPAATSR